MYAISLYALIFGLALTSVLGSSINSIPAESSNLKWDPTWDSLDSRPNPAWYDNSKVGIFIHWGVYSVPAFGSEWFWQSWKESQDPAYINFMERNYRPGFSYQEFAADFTAEFYNATEWVDLFKRAGAKYVVLTSKHHEGYSLYPSKYSFSWNSGDVGSHRDLVGELSTAVRGTSDLHFGLYHSRYEWFNPLWISDKANGHSTQEFVNFKTLPELYELVNTYQPEIVWSDGEWEAHSDYWKSLEFVAWLYNDSPVKDTVVTNDRWGSETRNTHGGFWTGQDRFNPGVRQPHKFENCYTLDKHSWGYRENAEIEDYLTPEENIQVLVETVSCGGNYLINVGPTKRGIIPGIMQERLLQLGEWLGINGEAIYETVPWTTQNDTATQGVWYTTRPAEKKVYAIVLNWPSTNAVTLGSVDPAIVDRLEVLGSTGIQEWSPSGDGISVQLPPLELNLSKWAWVVVVHTKETPETPLKS